MGIFSLSQNRLPGTAKRVGPEAMPFLHYTDKRAAHHLVMQVRSDQNENQSSPIRGRRIATVTRRD